MLTAGNIFGFKKLSELCNFLVTHRAGGECGVATLRNLAGIHYDLRFESLASRQIDTDIPD